MLNLSNTDIKELYFPHNSISFKTRPCMDCGVYYNFLHYHDELYFDPSCECFSSPTPVLRRWKDLLIYTPPLKTPFRRVVG